MPTRQIANLEIVLSTAISSGSTFSGWKDLGAPFSLFRVLGVITSSSGTYAGNLLGAQRNGSSAPTTGSTQYTLLASIDNTTQFGYNSSAVPCSFLAFLATAGPSTGLNTVQVSVACAG